MIFDKDAYYAGAKAYRDGQWMQDRPPGQVGATAADWQAGFIDAMAEDWRSRRIAQAREGR